MQKFNGYDEAKKAAESKAGEKLPKGAYVCKILEVKPDYENNRLTVGFDIVEGEYKDFFKKKFAADDSEDKKWKGRTTVWIPKDDNTEDDARTKKNFAGWTSSLEKSNPGYKWDWDESKWANKIVGIVFGETGTIIEGKEVVYTEARFPVDVEKVRSGKAPEAKFKSKNGYKGNSGNGGGSDAKPDNAFMEFSNNGDNTSLPF
jgi:hypothetical protein